MKAFFLSIAIFLGLAPNDQEELRTQAFLRTFYFATKVKVLNQEELDSWKFLPKGTAISLLELTSGNSFYCFKGIKGSKGEASELLLLRGSCAKEEGIVTSLKTEVEAYDFSEVEEGKIHLQSKHPMTLRLPFLKVFENDDPQYMTQTEKVIVMNHPERDFLKPGEKCLEYQKNCDATERNECHRCPKGLIPIVSPICPGKIEYECQNVPCGEEGAPACLRGLKYLGQELSITCFVDSPVGFCREGLYPFCDNSRGLICRGN